MAKIIKYFSGLPDIARDEQMMAVMNNVKSYMSQTPSDLLSSFNHDYASSESEISELIEELERGFKAELYNCISQRIYWNLEPFWSTILFTHIFFTHI